MIPDFPQLSMLDASEYTSPQHLAPAEWLRRPYTDGCPRCVGSYNRPIRLIPGLRDSVTGCYECRCGHRWTASYMREQDDA